MAGAGGFLLQEDADEALKRTLEDWRRQADQITSGISSQVNSLLNPAPPAATAQTPAPAAPPEPSTTLPPQQTSHPELDAFRAMISGGPPPPPTLPGQATAPTQATPSLPQAEEPATPADTAPSMGGKWKTSFDFGATYTGNYRTNTPHRGIDLVPTDGSSIGAQVEAFTPGTVALIQRDSGAGGLMVYVRDDQGLTHAYMHLAGTVPGLAVGQRVERGQPLALMGESGTEGHPHLHYEVRKNAATGDPTDQLIDPRPYMAGASGSAARSVPGAPAAPSNVQTTAGLSGGGSQAGQIGERGLGILEAAADISSWLGEQGQKALQAVLVTEGGLTGARGDNGRSVGPLQFFEGGQLANYAAALGTTLEQAKSYVEQHPIEAIQWAIGTASKPGYLGMAIAEGIRRNLQGPELATHAQRTGQVSVSPERAGRVWQDLFGQGQPAVQGAAQGPAPSAPFNLPQGPDFGSILNQGQRLIDQGREQLTAPRQANPIMASFDATLARGGQALQSSLNQGAQDVLQRGQQLSQDVIGATGSYFDRLGTGAERAAQHAIQNPLTPLVTPGEAWQGVTSQLSPGGAVRGALDTIGQRDEQATNAMADLALDKMRANGINPDPDQERFIRTAFRALSPSTLPLAAIGPGGPMMRAAVGAGGVVGGGLGMATGQAVGENVAPNLPEPIRPYAPLIGGLVGGLTGGIAGGRLAVPAAQAARGTVRGVARAVAEGGPEPGVIKGRYGTPRTVEYNVGAEPEPGTYVPPGEPRGLPAPQPRLGAGQPGTPLAPVRPGPPGTAAMATGWDEIVNDLAGPATPRTFRFDEIQNGTPTGTFLEIQGTSEADAARQLLEANSDPVTWENPGAAEGWVLGEGNSVTQGSLAYVLRPEPMAAEPRPAPEPALPAPSEGPTMGGGTVGITQSPEFLAEAMQRMYSGSFNKAAAKEGGQNFNDASYGIPGATAIVRVDNTAKTVSMLDQGKGMTAQTVEDVFVKLGGTYKPDPRSGGGMGTAIKAIMANSKDIWVRSIGRDPNTGQLTDSVMHGSGDDFLNGTMHRYYAARVGEMPPEELQGAPPEIHNVGEGPNQTGTLVWVQARDNVQWAPYQLNNWINLFNKTNKNTEQTVRFVIDGQEIGPGQEVSTWYSTPQTIDEAEKPSQFLKTITVPGAEVDIWASPKTDETGYADVLLLNNGQYQAQMNVRLPGNAKMPVALVADIRSTVGPKAPGYPWSADRNRLIDTTEQGISDYVSNELATDLIGQENQRVRDIILSAPTIGNSGLRLVDDAEVGQSFAAETLARIPKHAGYRRLANIINDLHENLIAELEGREIPTPVGPGTIGPSHMIGLAVSNKWVGLNTPTSFTPWAGSGDTAKGILIEPWKVWKEVENSFGGQGAGRADQIMHYADTLLGVMLHEISHNASLGTHEEGFAGLLTRIPQFLGSRMQQAITKELIRRLDTVWDTLVYDLATDAQQFYLAARPGELARFGVESGTAQPGGSGLRPTTGGQNVAGYGLGGPAGGPRAGGAGPAPASTPAGGQPQPGQAPATPAAPASPATGLVVRSGGVRAAQATQSLQQSLATLKPSKAQIAAATRDWLKMDRVGQRVVGVPEEVKSPRDLAALRMHIDSLVQAGVSGRDWYIDSAHKIEEATRGSPEDTEKLTQVIAMMATNINPDQNVNYAIEAWNQWKSGVPVNKIHRFDAISEKVAGLLERNENWEGRKTNTFYVNLKEELDPKLLALRKATVDQWINRAYGYVTKAPSTQQYNFMENEMRRMAAAQGLRPSQIQAMMWVGQMQLQAPNQKGEANFADALARRMGQVGIEADPEQARLFLDDNGVDIVARTFGGLGGHAFEVPGGMQTQVIGALTPKTEPGGQRLRPASRATIESIAAAKGHLLQLPKVAWTQVFPPTSATDANALDINFGRLLDAQETQQLRAALDSALGQGMYSLTHTELGAWVRNTNEAALPNPQFHKTVMSALDGLKSDEPYEATRVRADSNVIDNDWSAHPNGERYLDTIRRGGREEAFRSVQDSLGARLGGAQPRAPSQSTAPALEAPASGQEAGGAGPGPASGVQGAEDAGVSGFPTPGGQQLGSMALGGAGGAASDEDLSPEERLQRAGMGMLAAGAMRRPGGFRAPSTAGQNLQDVRTWLRAATPSQSTAPAVSAAMAPKTGGERVAEWISSNLLSGAGLVWNVLNQSMHLGWQPMLRAAEGHPLEALRGLQSIVASAPEALQRGAAVMGQGAPYAGVGGQQQRTLGRTALGLRANLGGDAILRTLNENMGGLLEAERLIRQAGAKTPQDMAAVIAQHAAEITEAAQKEGMKSALTGGQARTPWIEKLGQTKTDLLQSPEWHKQATGVLMHLLMPFARVPEELVYQMVRNAPGLGQVIDATQWVKAPPGEKGKAGATAGLNAAITATMIGAAVAGTMRGDDDLEHRNSVQIGGQWIPFSSLGTMGGRMAVLMALVDGIRQGGNSPEAGAGLKQAINNLGRVTVMDYPLFDTLKIATSIGRGDLTGAATQFGAQAAAGAFPLSGAMGAAENIVDPYTREASRTGPQGLIEPLMARIPGVSQALPPRVDPLTGGPLQRPSSGPGSLLRIQNAERPLLAEFARLNRLGYTDIKPPSMDLPRSRSVFGTEVPITTAQAQQIQAARGRMLAGYARILDNPNYARMSDLQKALFWQNALKQANAIADVVGEQVEMQTPNLADEVRRRREQVGRLVEDANRKRELLEVP